MSPALTSLYSRVVRIPHRHSGIEPAVRTAAWLSVVASEQLTECGRCRGDKVIQSKTFTICKSKRIRQSQQNQSFRT